MPLLEVVVGDRTALEAVATAVSYGRALGKTVVVVRDGPGFYVNRIIAPYIREAGWLLEQGVAIEQVDRALTKWGFPVGPFQLLDEVGLDVAAKSGAIMAEAFAARMPAAPALRRVLESGRAGRKAKSGFYAYDGEGKRTGVDATVYAAAGLQVPRPGARDAGPDAAPASVTDDEIVQRCVWPMLDEAVRCLEDEILQAPRDGDVGAVFGIGYPPFRGGPFRTLDAVGPAAVVGALEGLAARHGARFTPCDSLRRLARTGEGFYPREGKPVG
jgi:3-hydroxyacyl-CoA dehydrogenase/enoyl-CoA hydratase/3-hydroxybutyryl-CoA epimerase